MIQNGEEMADRLRVSVLLGNNLAFYASSNSDILIGWQNAVGQKFIGQLKAL